jgi:delta-aminolevulinic acid dehydratase/porphobilinogen synthase
METNACPICDECRRDYNSHNHCGVICKKCNYDLCEHHVHEHDCPLDQEDEEE